MIDFGAIAGRADSYLSGFTWKFWLIGLGAALAFTGVQTVRLAWAKTELAELKADLAEIARKQVEDARKADEGANRQREEDNERNRDADQARREAARDGRDAVNCERLRRAYPDRSFPSCD